MSAAREAQYPISVVVPTVVGWPAVNLALAGILPQLRALDGQLVVADVSRADPPAELLDDPAVIWLRLPGEWVTRARREAYRRAGGAIVALTEDHCVVADDWLERILAAHRRHPEAVAIAGAVANGTRRHVADWALYLMAHAQLASPLPPAPRFVGKTNVSYRAEVLREMPDSGPASIEDLWNQQLIRGGRAVVGDDSIRVWHHQCSSPAEMIALQFHNGRTVAAARRERWVAADLLRTALPPALAGFRTLRSLRQSLAKPLPRSMVVASLPLLGAMQLAHALGEMIGYVRGAGDSPHHLH